MENLALAVELMLTLTERTMKVAQLMQQAQASGTKITKEQLKSLSDSASDSLADLKTVIDGMEDDK